MAIELIDKIKQKNNGNFALVDACDIEFEDGERLDEKLSIATDEKSGLMNSQHVIDLSFAVENIKTLAKEKLSIPYDDNGEIVYGSEGDVLYSNGNGMCYWGKPLTSYIGMVVTNTLDDKSYVESLYPGTRWDLLGISYVIEDEDLGDESPTLRIYHWERIE